MIYKSLELFNWNCYKDPLKINFSLDPKKPITLIRGANQMGKTAFLRAMKWVFFGDTFSDSYQDPMSIINRQAWYDGEYKTNVKLTLIDNDKRTVVISRTLMASPGINKPKNKDFEMKFSLKIDGESLAGNKEKDYMKNLMPEQLKSFYIFDGEELDKFTTLNSKNQIKIVKDIHRILKIPFIETARDDCKYVNKLIRDEIDVLPADKQVEAMKKNKIKMEKVRDGLEKQLHGEDDEKGIIALISKNKDDLADAKKAYDEYENKLDDMAYKKTKEQKLKDEKKDINKHKEDARDSYPQILVSLRSTLLNSYKNELEKERSDIHNKYSKISLDNSYKTLIEKTVKDKKNICALCEQSLSKEKLDKFTQDLINAKGRPISTLDNNRLEVLGKIIGFIGTLSMKQPERFNLRIKSSINEINALTHDIEELDKKLKDVDDNVYQKIKSKYEGLNQLKKNLETQKTELEEQIEDKDSEIEELQNIIDESIKIDDQNKELKAQQQLATNLQKVYKEIVDGLASDSRDSIEKKSNEMMDKMNVLSSLKTKIRVNENYAVELVDENLNEYNGSATRQLLLALSLLYALTEVSGEKNPFVIDTPLGRVDLEQRKHILTCLPEMSDQIIMLVHDGEIASGDKVEKSASHIISKIYEIYRPTENEYVARIRESS